jgi:hypothetical protein
MGFMGDPRILALLLRLGDHDLSLLVKIGKSLVECGQPLIAGRVSMRITINLPPDLEQCLLRQSAQSNLH